MPVRGSKTPTVSVVWETFGIFFGRRDPNDFLSRLVTMDETWLYHYDPEKKQQFVEWRHSGLPHPKTFRVQKSAGKVLTSIFRDQAASSSLIIFQRAKLSTRSILISTGAIEGHFEGKTPRDGREGGSCSCTIMPWLTGHLQPRRNWPTWASSVLITHPILRVWPRRSTTCSLDWKKNIGCSPFFVRRGGHCCRGDLVGRTNFWFFWVVCKS